jgi:hypothetical protein
MIQKINEAIHNHTFGTIKSTDIYVVDFKNTNGGDVEVLETIPKINYVHLSNNNNIEIYYDAFKDNALVLDLSNGLYSKQCECVLFPSSCHITDWILFIETKYASDLKAAFNEKADYPNTMINQIISTVNYFRDKGILTTDRRVNAILSFPKLLEDFSESFFTRSEKTVEEILEKHKILLRATNEGSILSPKRIRI